MIMPSIPNCYQCQSFSTSQRVYLLEIHLTVLMMSASDPEFGSSVTISNLFSSKSNKEAETMLS